MTGNSGRIDQAWRRRRDYWWDFQYSSF